MDRLTTDNPQSNLMTALNLFYAKDGQAWVRGGGPRPDYPDVTLYDYTRATIWKLLKTRSELAVLSEDYYIQEIMGAWLLDGNNSIEGMIATLYTAGWAFAEIRARLSAFEDILGDTYDLDDLRELMEADREGRLVIMPPPAKEGDPKPSCFFNDTGGLWCNGMAPIDGDEPTERCKQCFYCEFGYDALKEE